MCQCMCECSNIMYVVCTILMIFMCYTNGNITGKAFLCRDPDTGKFHEVNTTWPSSTFCGNYHCKLRKKNLTETEYVPLRQINISNNDLQTRESKGDFINKDIDLAKEAPKIERSNYISTIHSGDFGFQDILKEIREEDNDRYLNEKEVKSIVAILHTIKKSDLDAIVEMYNLAEEIYKEIDTTSHNKIVSNDGINLKSSFSSKLKDSIPTIDKMKKISYWYDSVTETPRDRIHDVASADMHTLDTINKEVSTLKDPKITITKPLVNINSKYIPTEINKYFTKPPHYPLSAFETLFSSFQQSGTRKYTYDYTDTGSSSQKPQKETINHKNNIQQSYFLPYPVLYIPQYNVTYPQNTPDFNKLEYKINNRHENDKKEKISSQNPSLEKVQTSNMRNVKKSEKKKESAKKLYTAEIRPKTKYEYDWQTDPLSAQILSEVRANADKKPLRPFSLRKKLSLEKVGKVLKTDGITNRSKRSVEKESNLQSDISLFEPYLDKIICQTDPSEPGYFVYGNLSNPYPLCCPEQKS